MINKDSNVSYDNIQDYLLEGQKYVFPAMLYKNIFNFVCTSIKLFIINKIKISALNYFVDTDTTVKNKASINDFTTPLCCVYCFQCKHIPNRF